MLLHGLSLAPVLIKSSSLQICFILDRLIRINGFILQAGKKD